MFLNLILKINFKKSKLNNNDSSKDFKTRTETSEINKKPVHKGNWTKERIRKNSTIKYRWHKRGNFESKIIGEGNS